MISPQHCIRLHLSASRLRLFLVRNHCLGLLKQLGAKFEKEIIYTSNSRRLETRYLEISFLALRKSIKSKIKLSYAIYLEGLLGLNDENPVCDNKKLFSFLMSSNQDQLGTPALKQGNRLITATAAGLLEGFRQSDSQSSSGNSISMGSEEMHYPGSVPSWVTGHRLWSSRVKNQGRFQ